MANWVPSFIINELTGEKRQLVLEGRALPYQNFELEGSMRAELTWYPGNPIATVQMLGAEEKPSTVKGMWKDRFLGTQTETGAPATPTAIALWQGEQVTSARDLAAAVENLRLSGQLLRVSWGVIVREGVLTRFKQSWPRYEECEWEMEFAWVSRGEEPQPTTVPPDATTPQDYADEVVQGVAVMRRYLEDPPIDALTAFIQSVEAALGQLEAAMADIQDAVQEQVDLVLSPVQTVRRALGAANRAKNAAADIADTCASVPAQLIEEQAGVINDFGQVLQVDQFVRVFQDNARAIQLSTAQQLETLQAGVQPTELLAVFVASYGMDLRNVSVQYYGTQDQWLYLKTYNGFASSALTSGDVVLVPALGSGEEA